MPAKRQAPGKRLLYVRHPGMQLSGLAGRGPVFHARQGSPEAPLCPQHACRHPPGCAAREARPSGGSDQAVRTHRRAPSTDPRRRGCSVLPMDICPLCLPRTLPPLGGHCSALSCFRQMSPSIATTYSQALSPTRQNPEIKEIRSPCILSPCLTRTRHSNTQKITSPK